MPCGAMQIIVPRGTANDDNTSLSRSPARSLIKDRVTRIGNKHCIRCIDVRISNGTDQIGKIILRIFPFRGDQRREALPSH